MRQVLRLIGTGLLLSFVLGSLLAACSLAIDTDSPSRHQKLPRFDPYRTEFPCHHQADTAPPLDPEAERWFQAALEKESILKFPEDRDYPGAAKLYQQAVEKQHWKAMLNLANLHLEGKGVPPSREEAIHLVERAMQLGVAAAYDRMGAYIQNGVVPDGDSATRAYAFWQKAADMGSPEAQTFLGAHLLVARRDLERAGYWANKPIGRQMLECAFAQGHGPAAYELGYAYTADRPLTAEARQRALKVFHEGVKLGSADCASNLSVEFRGFNLPHGTNITGLDTARADRYHDISNELGGNPYLKLPNLDKILPLPPAELPPWDGKPESLIDAAKPVYPKPPQPQAAIDFPHDPRTLGHTGIGPERFEIPAGYALGPWRGTAAAPGNPAPQPGYWQPVLADRLGGNPLLKLDPANHPYLAEPRLTPPAFFEAGEVLPDFRHSRLAVNRPGLLAGLTYHFFGLARALPEPERHPLVRAGAYREIALPRREVTCPGDQPCPKAGIWLASVAKEHPLYSRLPSAVASQAYVAKEDAFPIFPRMAYLGIAADEVQWSLLEAARA